MIYKIFGKVTFFFFLFVFCFLGTRLNAQVTIYPNTVDENSRIGIEHLKNNELDKAINYFSAGLKINDRVSMLWNNLGYAYYRKGDKPEALKCYDKAASLDSQNLNAYVNRGDLNFDIKNFDAAVNDYSQGISITPKSPDLYYYRANAHVQNKNMKAALSDFDKAIGLDYAHVNALVSRAGIKAFQKDYAGALKDLDRVLGLQPGNTYGLYFKGEVLASKKDFYNALKCLNEAIVLNDKNADFYFTRANIYLFRRQYQLAEQDFLTSLKLNPETPGAVNNLGFIALQKGNYERAIEYFEKAIDQDGYIAIYYINLINTLGRNREFKAAAVVYNRYKSKNLSFQIEEKDIPSYKNFLEAITRNIPEENYKKALENINIAIKGYEQIFPTDEWRHVMEMKGFKAYVLEQLGQNDLALKLYEDVLLTQPDQPEIQAGIARLYKRANGNGGSNVSLDTKQSSDEIIPADLSLTKYHAIIIAEENYEDKTIPSLPGPTRDAVKLQDLLIGSYNFLPENVAYLKDKSREIILEQIRSKCKAIGPNDNLLIFFAGHGVKETDEQGVNYVYLIPSSAKKDVISSYISYNEIFPSLRMSRSKHILLIADACSSGAQNRSLGNDAGELLKNLDERPSRTLMTSGEEAVPDNSIFFSILLNRLQINKEKYLRARTLFDSLEDTVYRETRTKPNYEQIIGVGDKGGDFIFTKAKQ
ncbi:tetratricopeptide repeat protein [Pedobacter aquatilis]|uniref:tetratricopeptide repeat protein n=1 Tax=Pedobacter aquatilis TaxID=351343 RepID=UPI00292EE314|nr:tetratricopeptide repeat protein [Pedobacter aquatilis]